MSRHGLRKPWANPSVGARCGAFWIRMRSNPGGTSTGSFHVIPTLPRKLARFWTSMGASGKASALAPRTTSSVPTRRPVFRPASAVIPRCLPGQADRPIWTSGRIQTETYGFKVFAVPSALLNGFSGHFTVQLDQICNIGSLFHGQTTYCRTRCYA